MRGVFGFVGLAVCACVPDGGEPGGPLALSCPIAPNLADCDAERTQTYEASGTVSTSATVTHHDACGRAVTVAYTQEGVPVWDMTATYDPDHQGLVSLAYDGLDFEGVDGEVDSLWAYTFDEQDRPVGYTWSNPALGEVRCEGTIGYEDEDPLWETIDEACATGDTSTRYVWNEDLQQPTLISMDFGVDGVVDLTERYTWDGRGHLLTQVTDAPGGTLGDTIESGTWVAGERVRLERDEGRDGFLDDLTAFAYDGAGRETSTLHAAFSPESSDPVATWESSTSWTCPGEGAGARASAPRVGGRERIARQLGLAQQALERR